MGRHELGLNFLNMRKVPSESDRYDSAGPTFTPVDDDDTPYCALTVTHACVAHSLFEGEELKSSSSMENSRSPLLS